MRDGRVFCFVRFPRYGFRSGFASKAMVDRHRPRIPRQGMGYDSRATNTRFSDRSMISKKVLI